MNRIRRRTSQRGRRSSAGVLSRTTGAMAIALSVVAGSASAQTRVKVATVAPKGTPWSALLDKIKGRVSKLSDGALRFKVYYGGRLGGEKETVRETREGRVHMWGGSSAALATIVPELYALEMPFLFGSNEEADFVIDKYARPQVEKLLAAKGFVLYQFSENGWHGIGLRDRCVTGPKSLAGVKLRSQEAKVHLDMFRAMGANPLEMSVPEVLPALQQGTVDGFSNTPLFSFATSWYQGIRFFTPTRHVYQPAIVVYSKKWFDTLSAERRKWLLTGIEGDQKEGRRGVRAISDGLLQNFVRAKIQLCEISETQRESLRAATAQVLPKYERKASPGGKALFQALRKGKKDWAAGKR